MKPYCKWQLSAGLYSNEPELLNQIKNFEKACQYEQPYSVGRESELIDKCNQKIMNSGLGSGEADKWTEATAREGNPFHRTTAAIVKTMR